MHNRAFLLVVTFGLSLSGSLADPVDWVNPNYVLAKPSTGDTTSAARNAIVSRAGSSAKSGPWSLTQQPVLPPSGDTRDFLSWAPYHWPDCNWCSSRSRPPRSVGSDSLSETTGQSCQYNDTSEYRGVCGSHRRPRGSFVRSLVSVNDTLHVDTLVQPAPASTVSSQPSPVVPTGATRNATFVITPTPTLQPTTLLGSSSSSSSSDHVYSSDSTAPDAQFLGKTTSASRSTCTPSPTRSLAPSATWTTCPYKTVDGQINPDVRQLQGINWVMDATQSVLYNALASVLSGSQSYASTASSFIDAFFLDSKTGMKPSLNYAQLVRGPGAQKGQFMGVLDLRGMIKIANSIMVMRAAKSTGWTSARDAAMMSWTKTYITWLQTSPIGKAASAATNNHGTFYHGQLASLQVLVGDQVGARQTIKNFFTGAFRDQIARNGEQPWEAVRKGRGYHYRCFNLEALFTIGKIADQLGVNVWIAKSKSGATIQDALDYTMTVTSDPGWNNAAELAPHVAAASAIYGDTKGKYASFLQKTESDYKTQPFWYYDQPGACTFSTAALKTNRMNKIRRDQTFETYNMSMVYPACLSVSNATDSCTNPIPSSNMTDPYKPAVFYSVDLVQLDDDAFVTWQDVEPFYYQGV